MPRNGRPPIKIDKDQFEKLCGIQCTEEEIAGWFKCSIDTLNRWCKKEYNETFAETYKKYAADGKTSLRRYQFKLAQTNATMAIWLGKQYLGQREPQEDINAELNNKKISITFAVEDTSGEDNTDTSVDT